jgi:hypothetical protein
VRRPFQTRREIERYFSGKTITCLLCGRRLGRLAFHLAAKHGLTVDQYKARFGLPWRRGLTSGASHNNSGWSKKRKRKASRLARKTQFFKLAHPSSRREMAPFARAEALEHLGHNAIRFGKRFELRVRTLFRRGFTDKYVASVLGVGIGTVNQRTKHWRRKKTKRRRE